MNSISKTLVLVGLLQAWRPEMVQSQQSRASIAEIFRKNSSTIRGSQLTTRLRTAACVHANFQAARSRG